MLGPSHSRRTRPRSPARSPRRTPAPRARARARRARLQHDADVRLVARAPVVRGLALGAAHAPLAQQAQRARAGRHRAGGHAAAPGALASARRAAWARKPVRLPGGAADRAARGRAPPCAARRLRSGPAPAAACRLGRPRAAPCVCCSMPCPHRAPSRALLARPEPSAPAGGRQRLARCAPNSPSARIPAAALMHACRQGVRARAAGARERAGSAARPS